MDRLISILNDYGLRMIVVPEDKFLKIVNKAVKGDSSVISGIVNDFDKNKRLVYNSNIILDNEFTNEILDKLSFKWCSIGTTYLFRYLDYLKKLGLI